MIERNVSALALTITKTSSKKDRLKRIDLKQTEGIVSFLKELSLLNSDESLNSRITVFESGLKLWFIIRALQQEFKIKEAIAVYQVLKANLPKIQKALKFLVSSVHVVRI